MSAFTRIVVIALITALTLPSISAFAQEATIRVTRKATDQYAVSKSDIVITTKYCHEYVRDEEAVLTTRQDGADNALLFSSGAQCEVIAAVKPNDSKFNLLDFLIQLGLMIATKGVLGSVSNPLPMPKR